MSALVLRVYLQNHRRQHPFPLQLNITLINCVKEQSFPCRPVFTSKMDSGFVYLNRVVSGVVNPQTNRFRSNLVSHQLLVRVVCVPRTDFRSQHNLYFLITMQNTLVNIAVSNFRNKIPFIYSGNNFVVIPRSVQRSILKSCVTCRIVQHRTPLYEYTCFAAALCFSNNVWNSSRDICRVLTL